VERRCGDAAGVVVRPPMPHVGGVVVRPQLLPEAGPARWDLAAEVETWLPVWQAVALSNPGMRPPIAQIRQSSHQAFAQASAL